MNMLLGLLLIATLCGCAVLGDRRVAAGCQVADGVTTYYALTHGATETNGLLAGLSPGAILLLKLGIAYAIYKLLPPVEEATPTDKFAIGVMTVFGCVPAGSNIIVIRKLS